jgi:phi LC3 family holin
MRINWEVRVKNKLFWLAIIPSVLLVVKAIANAVGIQIEVADMSAKLAAVVEAVFGVLALLGVVNDPTTKGASDSDRAMQYDSPN